MRVLVTGATGFLGSNLARALGDRGDDVRALVRATSDRSRLAGLDVEFVEGDVTDADSVATALDGVDRVFHCAAVVEFGSRRPDLLEAINVTGTELVVGGAAERGIPTVHVSSLSALGATPPGGEPKDESWWDEAEPGVLYEQTKRRAHLYVRSLAASGAPVRIAMPGGIYGFGDESTMADLIRLFGLYPMPVGYLPEITQSTVHVEDCVDGLLRIADRGVDGGEYVVVAETVSLGDWIVLIAEAGGRRGPRVYLPTKWVRALAKPGAKLAAWFGQPPSMVPETVAVATHDCAYTGAKLRRELDWSPRTLTIGMQETVGAYRTEAAEKKAAKRAERNAKRARR